MIEDGELGRLRESRYAGWNGELGRERARWARVAGRPRDWVERDGIEPRPISGQQELLENVVNRQIWAQPGAERRPPGADGLRG